MILQALIKSEQFIVHERSDSGNEFLIRYMPIVILVEPLEEQVQVFFDWI